MGFDIFLCFSCPFDSFLSAGAWVLRFVIAKTLYFIVVFKAWPHKPSFFIVVLKAWPHKPSSFTVVLKAWPHKLSYFTVVLKAWPHKP